MTDELPLKLILQFLVKEGVALDRDKAKTAIEQEIGPLAKDNMISCDEFQKIFCRGIFKQAIVRSEQTFQDQMNSKRSKIKDMGLKQKINMFTRSNIVSGLMQPGGTDKNFETKQIIENLG